MPLPSTASEYIWYLKFQNSNLRRELEAYKSGNKFRKLCEKYEALLEKKDAEIRALKEECGRAHAETVTVRKYWSEIFDDVEAERKKAVLKAQAGTKRMEERALAAERKNDELSEKLKEERREKYELGEKLEEAEGLNKKLTAQVNRDFENSSTPSSLQGAGRKKIPNSREKTGKNPGGEIDISVGMINGLCEEFSVKTEPEKKRILEKLMSSPVMNVDFTNANVGGKSAQVLASEQNWAVLYVARESKGHNGIAGTLVGNYVGTLTHDHDTMFYSYGLRHQECQQHNIQYAKGCIENEPEPTWCVQIARPHSGDAALQEFAGRYTVR